MSSDRLRDRTQGATCESDSGLVAGDDCTMVTEVSADVPQAATPELPTHFGRYHILRRLGRGGMGAVYLAEDTQLGRRVALKVPRLGWVDDSAILERFFREARTAANLHHPNICPVYDVGQIDGIYHLTMAFIEGRPLAKLIDPNRLLPIRQSVEIVQQIASALEAAHQQGVIHRDLKPSNIIVKDDGTPVVMDFGLARFANQFGARITQSGIIVGTPAYMSPEQAAGDDAAVGPASDIYSLGIIFYELLTGRVPYEGSVTAVLCQIVMAEADPPRQIRPELDPRIELVCLKAMAKAVHDRFGSMQAFAAALASALAPEASNGAAAVAADSAVQHAGLPQHLPNPAAPPVIDMGKRGAMLAKASELFQRGLAEQALQVLAEAESAFPGDADVRALQSRYRQATAFVQETVRERVPELERQKNLNAVLEAVQRVRETGLPVKGLEEYAERIGKRMSQAAERVAYAKRRLDQHHYDEALAAAKEALATVADCPDARAVAQTAQRALDLLRHDARLITQATAARRWFFAKSILLRMRRDGLHDAMLSDLVAQIEFGVAQADRYMRLLTWTIVGGVVWLASGWFAGLATAALEPTALQWLGAAEPAGSSLAHAIAPMLQLLVAAGVLSVLQLGWRRSLGFLGAGRRLFSAFLGGLVVTATWIADARLAAAGDGAALLELVRPAGLICAALYGAVAGSIVAELATRLLGVVGSRPGWIGLCVGALGAVLGSIIQATPRSVNPLSAVLPTALLFGGLGLVLQIQRRSAYWYVLIAGVVSVGAELFLAEAGVTGQWEVLAATFIILTAAACAAFPSTRRWRTPALAALAAAASIALARTIEAVAAAPPATVLATTWALAGGAVALHCATHLQPVFHLQDRWRLHKLLHAKN